jgi:F-type H+-transporting ATPase subunit b
MNSKTKGFAGALGAALVTFAAPAVALAETPSGPDILLPKPAEFVPALIAFLIIWAVLAKLAWPSILKMMEQRQQKIQDDLDSAAKSKADAAREVKDLEARIAASHKDAEAIVAKAKREAEEERSRILAKAQREAADIVAKSRGAVQSERKKAMIELSSSVVDLSVEIASKIIGNELSEESQRKLAEKYLDEIGASDER